MNTPLFVCPACEVPVWDQGAIRHAVGCPDAGRYRELIVVHGEHEARGIMAVRQQQGGELAEGLVLVDLEQLDEDWE
jgi:hypothetical protein